MSASARFAGYGATAFAYRLCGLALGSAMTGLAEPKLALRSVVSEGWLGVRDGIRNWLITAA